MSLICCAPTSVGCKQTITKLNLSRHMHICMQHHVGEILFWVSLTLLQLKDEKPRESEWECNYQYFDSPSKILCSGLWAWKCTGSTTPVFSFHLRGSWMEHDFTELNSGSDNRFSGKQIYAILLVFAHIFCRLSHVVWLKWKAPAVWHTASHWLYCRGNI